MAVTPNMAKCEMCGAEFRDGPHRYEGKFIRAYQLLVCQACWNANWSGWNPRCGAEAHRSSPSERPADTGAERKALVPPGRLSSLLRRSIDKGLEHNHAVRREEERSCLRCTRER
jgi:hypothetical protein